MYVDICSLILFNYSERNNIHHSATIKLCNLSFVMLSLHRDYYSFQSFCKYFLELRIYIVALGFDMIVNWEQNKSSMLLPFPKLCSNCSISIYYLYSPWRPQHRVRSIAFTKSSHCDYAEDATHSLHDTISDVVGLRLYFKSIMKWNLNQFY